MQQPFVLVIDDDAPTADVARYMLKRSGFEVITAYSPERGLEVALHTRPDVVLCDVSMPHLSGLEILRQLKAHRATASIPVILMSGADKFDCGGMFTFLVKPFDSDNLVGAVRNAFESSGRWACGSLADALPS
jgi:DNA-binding NtrC family response regulator